MAKKEVTTEVKKEVVIEEKASMSYVLTFSDGTVIEGNTKIRQFQPNVEKRFQNTGYQVKVSDGDYSGNIMIIDGLRKVLL